MSKNFEGVYPVVLTLYKSDLSIDEEAVRTLVNFLIEKGVNGLWITGSISESVLLSLEEQNKLTKIIIDEANGKVPTIVTAINPSTQWIIHRCKIAKDLGADAVAALPPNYWVKVVSKPEVLYQHYSLIAKSIDLPLFIYNFPDGVGVNIPPSLISKLHSEFSNIIGLKDTTTDLMHIIDVLKMTNYDMIVFSGSEDMMLPTLYAGGKGTVSGIANVFPEVVVELYKAFKEKQYDKAIELNNKIISLRDIKSVGFTPVSFLKEALKIRGLPIQSYVRMPLLPLTEEQKNELKTKIEEVLGKEYLKI